MDFQAQIHLLVFLCIHFQTFSKNTTNIFSVIHFEESFHESFSINILLGSRLHQSLRIYPFLLHRIGKQIEHQRFAGIYNAILLFSFLVGVLVILVLPPVGLSGDVLPDVFLRIRKVYVCIYLFG